MSIVDKPVWAFYRAPCRPFDSGCRQCGKAITKGRAYCSAACSDVFQENHFWNTARWEAVKRAVPVDADPRQTYEDAAICAICRGPAKALAWPETVESGRTYAARYWAPEVNHKVPLNGDRQPFGCCHHQDNLECVCHPCHVALGIKQRADGLIGQPKAQGALPLELTS